MEDGLCLKGQKSSGCMKMLVLINQLLDGKMHQSSIRSGVSKLKFTADHKNPCLTK